MAQASLRWREVAGPDSRGYQAARIGAVLARLSQIAGDRTPQDLLLRAGEVKRKQARCVGIHGRDVGSLRR